MTRPVRLWRRSERSRERGVVLVYTLLVLLLISAVVAMASSAVLLRLQAFRAEVRDIQLQLLTDAALAEALAGLAKDPDFGGYELYDYPPLERESGTASGRIGSQVFRQGSRRWRITTEANWAGAERTAEAAVSQLDDGRLQVDHYRPLRTSSSSAP